MSAARFAPEALRTPFVEVAAERYGTTVPSVSPGARVRRLSFAARTAAGEPFAGPRGAAIGGGGT